MTPDLRLRVNGLEFSGWKGARVTRSMDSLCGSFELSVTDRWSGRSGPVLATAPASGMVVTGSANGPMLRDPQLDEFLQAHRQLGADAVLQAPAGGLHHATFAPPAR